MKSKLTLSLPAKTILEAKKIAKQRRTTVSALFAQSLKNWQFDSGPQSGAEADPQHDMSDLLGVLPPTSSYDARSAHIRAKHG